MPSILGRLCCCLPRSVQQSERPEGRIEQKQAALIEQPPAGAGQYIPASLSVAPAPPAPVDNRRDVASAQRVDAAQDRRNVATLAKLVAPDFAEAVVRLVNSAIPPSKAVDCDTFNRTESIIGPFSQIVLAGIRAAKVTSESTPEDVRLQIPALTESVVKARPDLFNPIKEYFKNR